MSFKRDGDDRELLTVLRQRRIKDLFAETIPEDEALLMSNGRLACVVCYQKPVFDTVNMLSIHRNGKKHLQNVEYQKQKREELRILIEKRRQEQLQRMGTTDIPQVQNISTGILGAIPYDPRAKKGKKKPYDRKQRLFLSDGLERPSSDFPAATQSSSLPGNKEGSRSYKDTSSTEVNSSSHSHSYHGIQNSERKVSGKGSTARTNAVLEKQFTGPVIHPNSLKRIFEQPVKGCEMKEVIPYTKKPQTSYTGQSLNTVGPKLNPKGNHVYWSEPFSSVLCTDKTLGMVVQSAREDSTSVTGACDKTSEKAGCKSKKKSKDHLVTAEQIFTPEQKDRFEKYRQLRGAGWKKDWDGKWIRDEDAEFDSDEDEPDLP